MIWTDIPTTPQKGTTRNAEAHSVQRWSPNSKRGLSYSLTTVCTLHAIMSVFVPEWALLHRCSPIDADAHRGAEERPAGNGPLLWKLNLLTWKLFHHYWQLSTEYISIVMQHNLITMPILTVLLPITMLILTALLPCKNIVQMRWPAFAQTLVDADDRLYCIGRATEAAQQTERHFRGLFCL